MDKAYTLIEKETVHLFFSSSGGILLKFNNIIITKHFWSWAGTEYWVDTRLYLGDHSWGPLSPPPQKEVPEISTTTQ